MTAPTGSGVIGIKNTTSGNDFGVNGSVASTSADAPGVNGYESAAASQVYGVNGNTSSTGPGAAGVNGHEGAATGQVFGVSGKYVRHGHQHLNMVGRRRAPHNQDSNSIPHISERRTLPDSKGWGILMSCGSPQTPNAFW